MGEVISPSGRKVACSSSSRPTRGRPMRWGGERKCEATGEMLLLLLLAASRRVGDEVALARGRGGDARGDRSARERRGGGAAVGERSAKLDDGGKLRSRSRSGGGSSVWSGSRLRRASAAAMAASARASRCWLSRCREMAAAVDAAAASVACWAEYASDPTRIRPACADSSESSSVKGEA